MTRICSVRIPDDVIKKLNDYCEGVNISEKVRDFVCNERHWHNYISHKINKLKAEISVLEEAEKSNIFSDKYEMEEDMKEWLLNSAKSIRENPDYFLGRYQFFQSTFGKKLTMNDFKLLLREVEDAARSGTETN